MKSVMVVGFVLAGCLSPVMTFGGGKTPQESQRKILNDLMPSSLSWDGKPKGEVKPVKVRVWADDDYRAQNMTWQKTFSEELEVANEVLGPMLGIKLEPEFKVWQHHAPGTPIEDELAALHSLDRGDDVFAVIGLTTSIPLVSASFELLGVATIGGNHMVLRGYADVEERKALERVFKDLDKDTKEGLYDARRRHKTAAILLHELGHNLGLDHENSTDGLMNAAYQHHALMFDEHQRDAMLATLDRRAHGDRSAPKKDEPAGVTTSLPQDALDELHRAEQLAAGGRRDDARAALAPLLKMYPAHAQLRVVACKIELAKNAKDPKALAVCDRAAELVADAASAVALATVRGDAGDAAGARAAMVAAEARLVKLSPDEASAGWLALAAYYKQTNAVTWAEDAAVKAGDDATKTWAAMTRARYGVPRDQVKPEDDAAAVTAVRGVIDLGNASKLDAAVRAAATAEKRWPGLPGLYAARCDLEVKRHAYATARPLCARAIAHGNSSWGAYLSGILELQDTSDAATARGIARLREAIALDPELGQAWRALGKALARARASSDLEQLRRDYATRFGQPLP